MTVLEAAHNYRLKFLVFLFISFSWLSHISSQEAGVFPTKGRKMALSEVKNPSLLLFLLEFLFHTVLLCALSFLCKYNSKVICKKYPILRGIYPIYILYKIYRLKVYLSAVQLGCKRKRRDQHKKR